MPAEEGREPLSDIYHDGRYAKSNPTWHEEDSPWKAAQILRLLRDRDVRPATMAEIGCGAGGVLAAVVVEMPSVKWAEGWDVAREAIERAERYQNERMNFVTGDMLATDKRYDLCLCIDVFEHVPNYMGFLRALRGHAERHIFHIPLDMHVSALLRDRHHDVRASVGHLHYFSRGTALATLADCGYRVEEARFTAGSMARLDGHRGWRTDLAEHTPPRSAGQHRGQAPRRLLIACPRSAGWQVSSQLARSRCGAPGASPASAARSAPTSPPRCASRGRKPSLGHRRVAVPAEQDVHQRAGAVDGTAEVAPAPADLEVDAVCVVKPVWPRRHDSRPRFSARRSRGARACASRLPGPPSCTSRPSAGARTGP